MAVGASVRTDPFPTAPSRTFEGNAADSSRQADGYWLHQHYLRNFEDLLGETNRNDRDGQQSLDLLTGDAGKVYTMLGHAAGRFE